jgi:GNAT superfamily N-acetyltransferase
VGGVETEVQFVTAESADFRALAAKLDAYYFTLVGDIQLQYAEPNRPENMSALALVYRDGRAIACGAWKALDEATAEIKRIFVEPDFRRCGVATALIRALEASAAATGRNKLILETAVDTAQSHRLYLSLGYQIREYYGSPAGAENCLCFEKEITL